VIVADTGAIIALVDADDKHHRAIRALFENDPESWLLPWAVLPEVDYLLSAHVG
jgi:predicted nucleic acid-binding protein